MNVRQFYQLTMTGLLVLVVAGCNSKSGVDAKDVTAGGPRQKTHKTNSERVEHAIKELENAEIDKQGSRNFGMKIGALGAMGAEAEPALPVLEKILSETQDEDIKIAAEHAIKRIQEAVAAQE